MQRRTLSGLLAIALLGVVGIARAEAPPVFLLKWGGLGTGDGMGMPWGLAVGPSGAVFETDLQNRRVQKFSADGTFLLKWGGPGTGNGQFSLGPAGIAAVGQGVVYVTGDGRIQRFDQAGTFLGNFAGGGVGTAMDVDPTDQYLYVASAGGVLQYSTDGAFIRRWDTTNSSLASNQGIAVGPSGHVYVSEGWADMLYKYTADGVLVWKFGGHGSGDGQFSNPHGVAVDAEENIYVCDAGNDRIQKFTSEGVFLTKWGTRGSGDGEFAFPTDVAVDSDGNVYVVDYGNERIQKFGEVPTPTVPTSWGDLKAKYRDPAVTSR